MSKIAGQVGSKKLEWQTVPSGNEGASEVLIGDKKRKVRWRRDGDGLWIELDDRVVGFDVGGELNDDGVRTLTLRSRMGDGDWKALRFVRAGDEAAASASGAKKKGLRVRAQMPGKIVKVMVKDGDTVEKGQPLLVMEAMKMENEIKSAGPGRVKTVKVTEGQNVESGADLILIDNE
jgi:acetyl/propionyl-CoA carboxylase alpha subunit